VRRRRENEGGGLVMAVMMALCVLVIETDIGMSSVGMARSLLLTGLLLDR